MLTGADMLITDIFVAGLKCVLVSLESLNSHRDERNAKVENSDLK